MSLIFTEGFENSNLITNFFKKATSQYADEPIVVSGGRLNGKCIKTRIVRDYNTDSGTSSYFSIGTNKKFQDYDKLILGFAYKFSKFHEPYYAEYNDITKRGTFSFNNGPSIQINTYDSEHTITLYNYYGYRNNNFTFALPFQLEINKWYYFEFECTPNAFGQETVKYYINGYKFFENSHNTTSTRYYLFDADEKNISNTTYFSNTVYIPDNEEVIVYFDDIYLILKDANESNHSLGPIYVLISTPKQLTTQIGDFEIIPSGKSILECVDEIEPNETDYVQFTHTSDTLKFKKGLASGYSITEDELEKYYNLVAFKVNEIDIDTDELKNFIGLNYLIDSNSQSISGNFKVTAISDKLTKFDSDFITTSISASGSSLTYTEYKNMEIGIKK